MIAVYGIGKVFFTVVGLGGKIGPGELGGKNEQRRK